MRTRTRWSASSNKANLVSPRDATKAALAKAGDEAALALAGQRAARAAAAEGRIGAGLAFFAAAVFLRARFLALWLSSTSITVGEVAGRDLVFAFFPVTFSSNSISWRRVFDTAGVRGK